MVATVMTCILIFMFHTSRKPMFSNKICKFHYSDIRNISFRLVFFTKAKFVDTSFIMLLRISWLFTWIWYRYRYREAMREKPSWEGLRIYGYLIMNSNNTNYIFQQRKMVPHVYSYRRGLLNQRENSIVSALIQTLQSLCQLMSLYMQGWF